MSGAGAGCCLSSAPGEGALWFSPTLALYRYLSLKTGHTLEKTLLVFYLQDIFKSSENKNVLFRVRLGIDFPLPGVGVGNVKQLTSSNVIPDSSDYDVTVNDTEEVVEAVENEAEEVVEAEEDSGDSNKVEVEEPEPCCDNLVSNTVELVNEVSEETIDTVTEDISENVKWD